MSDLTFEEIQKAISHNTYPVTHYFLKNKCGNCGRISPKMYIYINESGGIPVRGECCKTVLTEDARELTTKDIFAIKCLI